MGGGWGRGIIHGNVRAPLFAIGSNMPSKLYGTKPGAWVTEKPKPFAQLDWPKHRVETNMHTRPLRVRS